MHRFSRRQKNAAATLIALAVVAWWARRVDLSLGRSAYHTGWALLALLFVLASYQLRKRFPSLPVGRASTWFRVHLYVGLGSAAVFLLHIGWTWPNGVLETTLAGLYVATILSGLIGWYWTRTLPKQLARVGEEVIYEQIPRLRSQLRRRAQAIILGSVRTTGEATLGEFYNRRLHDFFEYPRDWHYRLFPTSRRRKLLMAEITETTRYLSDSERKTAEQLFALVRRRDDVDYHEALQWRLKAWLFVHIGLTYPLLLASCVHGWLAHVFTGALP